MKGIQLSSPRIRPGRTQQEQGELLAELGILFGVMGLVYGAARSSATQLACASPGGSSPLTTGTYTPPVTTGTCTGCQSCG